jgi:hypothetical protein
MPAKLHFGAIRHFDDWNSMLDIEAVRLQLIRQVLNVIRRLTGPWRLVQRDQFSQRNFAITAGIVSYSATHETSIVGENSKVCDKVGMTAMNFHVVEKDENETVP